MEHLLIFILVGIAILYGVIWSLRPGKRWEAVAFILTIIVAIAIQYLSR